MADDMAAANSDTILTVGMAAITTISGAIGAYFSYRTTRDKMQYDAERVAMRKDIQHLKEKVDSCHTERDLLSQKCDALEAEIAELRHRMDDRSATHAALDRRKHPPDPDYQGPRTRGTDSPKTI